MRPLSREIPTVVRPARLRALLACARLDLAEALRSRWFLLCSALYLGLAAAVVATAAQQSALFGYAGSDRVLLAFGNALDLTLPLLALLATGTTIGRARDDGSLELVLSQPLSRTSYFAAVTLVRLGVLYVPLVVTTLGAALFARVALGAPVPWDFVARALAVSLALLVAFTGLGLAIATVARAPGRAIVAVLLVWALSAALLDLGLIGVMLRLRLEPAAVFALAAANPVEAARLALLSGVSVDLPTLGPVGFWLATRVGPAARFALGVAWPALVGLAAWAAAARRFSRGDVV
jgi:ABC-2 type transport system permease protein